MKTLPANLSPFRRTATFTEQTIPNAMLRAHFTAAGVWGVIHVQQGQLRYAIDGGEVHLLSPGVTAIIEPQVGHSVTPVGEVSFYVEFFKEEAPR
ncbi:MAG: DUF1971 domain-containing protein [Bryobacteraceae bacterium]